MSELAPALSRVGSAYRISIRSCHPVGRVWRLETDRGAFALKRALPPPEAAALRSIETHLLRRGFDRFSRPVVTKAGDVEFRDTGGRFVLRPWLPGRCPHLDLEHPHDLKLMAEAAADMHLVGIGWHKGAGRTTGKYSPVVLHAHLNELRGFNLCMDQGKFTRLYRPLIAEALAEGRDARAMISEADYEGLVDEETQRGGFCHGDLAPNNALTHAGSAYLIDFDRSRLDVSPVDLAMLIQRVLAAQDWRPELAERLIEDYIRVRTLSLRDLRLAIAFLHWPQLFWRLGHQYFVEHLDRPESFYLRRLGQWTRQTSVRRRFLGIYRQKLW